VVSRGERRDWRGDRAGMILVCSIATKVVSSARDLSGKNTVVEGTVADRVHRCIEWTSEFGGRRTWHFVRDEGGAKR
jgi:hypothetical protein